MLSPKFANWRAKNGLVKDIEEKKEEKEEAVVPDTTTQEEIKDEESKVQESKVEPTPVTPVKKPDRTKNKSTVTSRRRRTVKTKTDT